MKKLTYGREEAESMMPFEAVRGIQAKREFYTTMCDFETISNHFQFGSDSTLPAEMRSQRKIRNSRIHVIKSYITQHPDTYIFSAITVSVNKKITFNPVPGTGSDSKIGKLFIPSNAKILVNDGQHRCAAIKMACDENPNIGRERISVVIFEDRGLERSQQMFADLNKHAIKPTKSLGILYDHRDTFARFIVTLANDLEIFQNRTEMERTNIGKRSLNVFTLNGIADATRHLLKLKTKSVPAEKQKLVVSYWNNTAKYIPQWNLLLQNKITPTELRENYIHANTNILNALGMVGFTLTQYPDWTTKIKKFRKINWMRDAPEWKNKVIMDGKLLKNRLGIKRAAREILKQIGVKTIMDGDVPQ